MGLFDVEERFDEVTNIFEGEAFIPTLFDNDAADLLMIAEFNKRMRTIETLFLSESEKEEINKLPYKIFYFKYLKTPQFYIVDVKNKVSIYIDAIHLKMKNFSDSTIRELMNNVNSFITYGRMADESKIWEIPENQLSFVFGMIKEILRQRGVYDRDAFGKLFEGRYL